MTTFLFRQERLRRNQQAFLGAQESTAGLRSRTSRLVYSTSVERKDQKKNKNHSTQDSRVVPHHGTNWAVLCLTSQIRRDTVLSESYGRGYITVKSVPFDPFVPSLQGVD
jgi:hypothetical protein